MAAHRMWYFVAPELNLPGLLMIMAHQQSMTHSVERDSAETQLSLTVL